MLALPYAVMREKQVRDRVHEEVAKYVAWNLDHMQAGVAPRKGFYGEEFPAGSMAAKLAAAPLLASGWTATFFGWHGDHKSRRETHRLSQHYNCTYLCDVCFAVQNFAKSNKLLLYQNFRPDALHKLTRFANAGLHVMETGRVDHG